jgi:hypothetical protein
MFSITKRHVTDSEDNPKQIFFVRRIFLPAPVRAGTITCTSIALASRAS